MTLPASSSTGLHRGRKTPRLTRAVAAMALGIPAVAVPIIAAPTAADAALPADWSAPSAPGPSRGYSSDPYGDAYGGPYGGGPFGGGRNGTDPYAGGGSSYGSNGVESLTAADLDATDATAAQSAGIVMISSTIDFGTGEGAGTGLILDSDGIVVTNHHVIEGSTDLVATDAVTGETYPVTVLGHDATSDIAVLQLEGASGLTPVDLDDDGVTHDQAVTAVGDAGGDGGTLTAAAGTVTATDESISVDNQDGTTSDLSGLIQVDADIIPGDSGGALLDAEGEVVGMNVAAGYARSATGGIDITGYVIPIATVESTLDQVLAGTESGSVVLGYAGFLGISLSATGDSTTLAGVVADGPAEAAGLTAGDTVTALDGTTVRSATRLQRLIGTHDAGESVSLTWTDTSGDSHTATVTLDEAPIG